MKTNHVQVESLIRQAIAACKEDEAFSTTKVSLRQALARAAEVSKKRGRNYATQDRLKKGAENKKSNWNNWWETLKKNAKIELPELPEFDETAE